MCPWNCSGRSVRMHKQLWYHRQKRCKNVQSAAFSKGWLRFPKSASPLMYVFAAAAATEKAMAPHSSTLAWKIPWKEVSLPVARWTLLYDLRSCVKLNSWLNLSGLHFQLNLSGVHFLFCKIQTIRELLRFFVSESEGARKNTCHVERLNRRCVLLQSLRGVRLQVSVGLRHNRLPCPSLSPGFELNSCPSSRWCQPTVSPSVSPFSSLPWVVSSKPVSGFFPMY